MHDWSRRLADAAFHVISTALRYAVRATCNRPHGGPDSCLFIVDDTSELFRSVLVSEQRQARVLSALTAMAFSTRSVIVAQCCSNSRIAAEPDNDKSLALCDRVLTSWPALGLHQGRGILSVRLDLLGCIPRPPEWPRHICVIMVSTILLNIEAPGSVPAGLSPFLNITVFSHVYCSSLCPSYLLSPSRN